MERNQQRLQRETRLREQICQFLSNTGQSSDEEWWEEPQAVQALERLAGASQWAAASSQELCAGSCFVAAVWNGGLDAGGMDRLLEDLKACAAALARDSGKSGGSLPLQFLFFCKDVRNRVALEMKFNRAARDSLKKAVNGDSGVTLAIGCVYRILQEYHGERARIQEINHLESVQMPPVFGRPNREAGKAPGALPLSGAVMTVRLKHLVDLYNLTGDQLFRNNVRFGIREALDVSSSIQKTLEEEPDLFWFKNNGVTLLVESPDFSLPVRDELRLGVLEANRPPQFSIVNGAQTITISARYAFELEYQRKLSPDSTALRKKQDNFDQAKVLLRVIHIPIQEGAEDGVSQEEALASSISVSLNRQKPIRQEDIAFTVPFVQKLTEYLERQGTDAPFQLIRRGEENPYAPQLNLVDFSRACLACGGRPGKARTASGAEIMKMNLDTGGFQETQIFREEWMAAAENEEEEAVFRRFYGAVWFASQTAGRYAKAAGAYRNETGSAAAAARNGKWYFTALAVQVLNRFRKSEDGQPDYSDFEVSPQAIADVLPVAVFAEMAASCAEEGQVLDSNDFKSDALYERMLEKLPEAPKGSPFQRFSKLLLDAAEGRPKEEREDRQKKVTAIALGSGSARTPVRSAADAFGQTVHYIVEASSFGLDDLEQMKEYETWLTFETKTGSSQKGYFAQTQMYRHWDGYLYWVGVAGSNTQSKITRLKKLCKNFQVPQGEITWYAGEDAVFSW